MPGTNREPPPPPGVALPVDDEDIIDVVIGVDEERATARKRRLAHGPLDEEGVPRGADVGHEAVIANGGGEAKEAEPSEAAAEHDGGVAADISLADTARYGEGEEDRKMAMRAPRRPERSSTGRRR